MASTARLAIEVTADTDRAESAFKDAGAAAEAMAKDVDRAADRVAASASKMDRAADAADTLDSRASQATGGLGALAAGMELVGADAYAEGLQKAAMATDFLSGVGAIANLVTTSGTIAKIRDTAATVAHAAATKASAAATAIMTAAQRALNLAMKANPIMLIITAVVALVAGLVLLYKKSEKFRAIVDTIGRVAKDVFGRILEVIGRVAGAFAPVISAVRTAANKIKELWKPVGTVLGGAFEKIGNAAETVFGAMKKAARGVKNALGSLFGGIIEKIAAVIEKAQDAWGWIKRVTGIGGGNQPDVNLGRDLYDSATNHRRFGRDPGQSLPGRVPNGRPVMNITVNGAVDPASTARQIGGLLSRHAIRMGDSPAYGV